MKFFAILLLFVFVSAAGAQTLPTSFSELSDSSFAAAAPTKSRRPINPEYAAPVVMFGLGLLANNSHKLHHLNKQIRAEVLEDKNRRVNMKIDDALQYTPAEAVFALNLLGFKSRNGFMDRAFLYGLSHYIGKTTTDNLKGISGRMRPDGSDRRSFPSGHTTTAFAAAEFMRLEYRDASPLFGISAYAIAATTGALRIYHNKHWFTDVIAGAGVGILSTDLAYFLYPRMKRFVHQSLKINTQKLQLSPVYQSRTAGLSLIYRPDK
ncbi:phosphatase PAP2 family protein [Pedobacter sp. SYSU D00535]|uniref:phosphatase PAP2 family protein n=1 Tax=Pedobacter sp. SYSU D00535 TaxID=2810308 RepID=UPI001A976E67|nr:phosphatase PAP2 family protein [Pedobacter sp. SYSU D00535]